MEAEVAKVLKTDGKTAIIAVKGRIADVETRFRVRSKSKSIKCSTLREAFRVYDLERAKYE